MNQSPLVTEFGHLADRRIDIRDLVDRLRNLLIYAQPLIKTFRYIGKVARWENGWISFSIFLTCNLAALLLTSLGSMLILLCVVGTLVSLGLCHRKSQLLVKVFPNAHQETDYNTRSHSENMQEFRLLLVLVDSIVRNCSTLLLRLYSVLKCEDLHLTLKCYAALTLAILILISFPLRIFLALVVDSILLFHPLHSYVDKWSQQMADTKDLPSISCNLVSSNKLESEDAISQSSDALADGGFGTDSDCSEKLPDDSCSDDDSSQELNAGIGEPVVQPPPQTQHSNSYEEPPPKPPVFTSKPVPNSKVPALVEKLIEMKRRKGAVYKPPAEKCSGCSVMFTTILKRKHICSNCGFHFCSRCCSNKVPRSTFGATAPAAQTETVAVCVSCYDLLVGSGKDKTR